MPAPSLATTEILQRMEVPDYPAVYALGCLERRVTVYSQQVRALNLVYALTEESKVVPGDTLAVVGAGIGGLTVAAAAATLGINVRLFEKQTELVPLLRGCRGRWLHPHVYDWATGSSSASDALRTDADLPILDWSAGPAADVVAHLLSEWNLITLRTGRVLEGVDSGLQQDMLVRTTTGWKIQGQSFKAVVLAVGFGVEHMPEAYPLDQFSYWRDDAFHQTTIGRTGGQRQVLIVGRGDGGLTDVFRFCLNDFDHSKFVSDFLDHPSLASITARLASIENIASQLPEPEASVRLASEYAALDAPEFDEALIARQRHDIHVTLADPGATPFSLRASVYNRFLASRLLKNGMFEYKSGRVAFTGPPTAPIRVQIGSEIESAFDTVVPRIGPSSALQQAFPRIASKLGEPRHEALGVDPTRSQQWTTNFGTSLQSRASSDVASGNAPKPVTRLTFWSLDAPIQADGTWRYHLGQLYVLERLAQCLSAGDRTVQIVCDPAAIRYSRRRPAAGAESATIQRFLESALRASGTWSTWLSELTGQVSGVDETAFQQCRDKFLEGVSAVDRIVERVNPSEEFMRQLKKFREPLVGPVPDPLRAAVLSLQVGRPSVTDKHALAILHLFVHRPIWFDVSNLTTTGVLLHRYTQLFGPDVVVMEASRNAYVWLAIEGIFFGWVKSLTDVAWPTMDFLENVPDLSEQSFMRLAHPVGCLFIDSTSDEAFRRLRAASPEARASIFRMLLGSAEDAQSDERIVSLLQRYRGNLPAVAP